MFNNNPKLNVALFDMSSTGGICHYTFHLAESLAGQGADVTLFTTESNELRHLERHFQMEYLLKPSWVKAMLKYAITLMNGSVSDQESIETGSDGIRRPNMRILTIVRLWVSLLKLTGVLFLRRCSIVHLQWLSRGMHDYYFMRMLKALGFRIIYTAHNVLPHSDKSVAAIEFFDKVYSVVDRIIVHAEDNKNELIELFRIVPEKIVVIPHGTSDIWYAQYSGSADKARHELGIALDDKVVLFFGAIQKYKGLDLLLEAFEVVKNQIDRASLLVAGTGGSGYDAGYYRNIRRQLYATETVKFIEAYIPSEKVGLYFSAADVVALPYRKTYQSGVLFLAYAAGRPVVATETGGLAEVVENGKSGLVVPPGDVGALAEAIVALLQDPVKRREMGDYARFLGEAKYSWKTAACRTMETYLSIVGDHGRPSGQAEMSVSS